MKSNTIKKNNGITLIALIITIIVMLILVSVTISMAVNGGLFNYAGRAARETKNAVNAENELSKGRIQIGGVWYDSIGDYLEKKPSSNQGETDGEDEINAVGVVDNENTITLASNLPNDTYILKYENNSGVLQNYKEICTLTATAESTTRVYDDLIAENCAPVEATIIGVYNSSNERVGDIALGHLGTNLGNKLYSFGALMDCHIGTYTTSEDKFSTALAYLKNQEEVDFTCIAGDLTNSGTEAELTEFQELVNTYSNGTPVYAAAGNHEGRNANIEEIIEQYTGKPLYYSFTKGNDVFIFVGNRSEAVGSIFTTEELKWLYETLEANRNKRCFVFQHVRSDNTSGNAFGIYPGDIWGGAEATAFEGLMEHYTNVTWFHGHTHLKYYLQYGSDIANYDNSDGYHSVHIPSISMPRDGNSEGSSSRVDVPADSEGCIVDVYENGIVLRGRDFVGEKFLPIAQYYLDTTLKTIEEDTYIDNSGIIKPNYTNMIPLSIDVDGTIFNGQGYMENKRLNSSGAVADQTNFLVTGFIPAKYGDTIYVSNMTFRMGNGEDSYCYIWAYDENFSPIKGGHAKNINVNLSSTFTTTGSDNNLVSLTLNSSVHDLSKCAYIRVSYQAKDSYAIITVNEPIV